MTFAHDPLSGTLIFAGLLLHFLSRWGEHWRTTAHDSPIAYLKLDAPGWAAAAVAALASYLVLPQLGPYVGVEPPLGALAAGYTASSLAAKLPNLAGRSGVR